MLNFDFLEKALGIASPAQFLYDFSRKINSYYILLTEKNFIVRLPLLLGLLGNTYIAIDCFPGCDVINFEINLASLIKPFLYMAKKSRQKFKYLENEKSFQKTKSIFHHF